MGGRCQKHRLHGGRCGCELILDLGLFLIEDPSNGDSIAMDGLSNMKTPSQLGVLQTHNKVPLNIRFILQVSCYSVPSQKLVTIYFT